MRTRSLLIKSANLECVCVYVCRYVHLYICMYVCASVYMCIGACVYVYMYEYICICIHGYMYVLLYPNLLKTPPHTYNSLRLEENCINFQNIWANAHEMTTQCILAIC